MPQFFFETYGCQMNVADSGTIADLLRLRGYTAALTATDADLILVNTCSVREHAEQRALARLRELCSKKKRSQSVWVIGCMAERLGTTLIKTIPAIDRVIGAKAMDTIAEQLNGLLPAPSVIDCETPIGITPSNTVSTLVPVMRGCDNYCAYCIVPYVRGHEHSLPHREIIAQIESLCARGVVEITLVGQNVNSYHDRETDFADLLHHLHAIPALQRIRFVTSHPKDLSDKLIDTMAKLPKLCKHIHLPLQAGSTAVLTAMNRRYTAEHYLRQIEKLRSAIPHLDITTDLMVGFPGETTADFEQTMALVQQVKFTMAFMFAYSIRPGTAAATLADTVSAAEKSSRLNTLVTTQTAITKEIYAAMVGARGTVLATERQREREKMWIAHDNGCKRILLQDPNEIAGRLIPVLFTRSSGMTLIAERISA